MTMLNLLLPDTRLGLQQADCRACSSCPSSLPSPGRAGRQESGGRPFYGDHLEQCWLINRGRRSALAHARAEHTCEPRAKAIKLPDASAVTPDTRPSLDWTYP